jgi:hypothetical protein
MYSSFSLAGMRNMCPAILRLCLSTPPRAGAEGALLFNGIRAGRTFIWPDSVSSGWKKNGFAQCDLITLTQLATGRSGLKLYQPDDAYALNLTRMLVEPY